MSAQCDQVEQVLSNYKLRTVSGQTVDRGVNSLAAKCCRRCERTITSKAGRGYCATCYLRARKRTGRVDKARSRPAKVAKTCMTCHEAPVKSRGRCMVCWKRARKRAGRVDRGPLHDPNKVVPLCARCGKKPVRARSLCKVCARRARARGGRVDRVLDRLYQPSVTAALNDVSAVTPASVGPECEVCGTPKTADSCATCSRRRRMLSRSIEEER